MRSFTLIILLFLAGLSSSAGSAPRSTKNSHDISIVVDARGFALIGRDTLTTDQLSAELKKRLWKSYMGTGKMYDSIHLSYTGEVSQQIKSATIEAIKLAQKNALTEVCLQIHNNRFEKLNARQQKKLQTEFPVLFQANY